MNLNTITGLFTGNPWIYAGVFAAGAALSGFATYEVKNAFDQNTIKDLKLAASALDLKNANNALNQFVADASKITAAASEFGDIKLNLNSRFDTISKEFNNAIKAHPLPPGCKPDDGRMQSFLAAVHAANAAATGAGQRVGGTVRDTAGPPAVP